jgi:hypothetical protein
MKRLVGTALAFSSLILGLAPMTVLAQAGLTISTAYPAVTVDPAGTAKFDLDITTPTPERVDLTVSGAPEGWTARLRGGGSTISAVYTSAVPTSTSAAPAEPRATATLEVTLPETVAPDTYTITISGTSASGLTASLGVDLTVQQAGTGSVSMNAANPLLQGKAGTTFTFDVSVKNDTNQEIPFVLDVQGPAGWTVTTAASMPQGVAEWQGWSFTTDDFWTRTAPSQSREANVRARGVFAVADPDEWDDKGSPSSSGKFDSTMTSPAYDVTGKSTVRLEYGSHYLQEGTQRGTVSVSFDGGPAQIVKTHNADGLAQRISLNVTVPSGARTARVSWRLFDAGNNWYWAVDAPRLS